MYGFIFDLQGSAQDVRWWHSVATHMQCDDNRPYPIAIGHVQYLAHSVVQLPAVLQPQYAVEFLCDALFYV